MDILNRLVTFFILLIVQVLVLNHIHLFNVATPLLYVAFVLGFQRNYPRWGLLLWCFFLGLSVDIFANTPGVAAASMTLIGLIQPYLLEFFVPRDASDDFQISVSTVGIKSFAIYSSIIVFIYCLVFFTLEAFNFFNVMQWILNVSGSTLLTIVILLATANLIKK